MHSPFRLSRQVWAKACLLSLLTCLHSVCPSDARPETVVWADYLSGNAGSAGLVTGTINDVTVTYSGDVSSYSTGGGTNYWTEGTPKPYTGNALVSNAPASGEMISLAAAGGTNTFLFSRTVYSPLLAITSLGQGSLPVTYTFDHPFTVLSSGQGYWGSGTYTTTGSNAIIGREFNGLLQFPGYVSTLSWSADIAESSSGGSAGVTIGLLANYASALEWAGGASSWNQFTQNWKVIATGAASLWQPSGKAVFNGPGGVVDVQGEVTVGAISFDTAGYTLRGGTLALSGAQVLVMASAPATISAEIIGSSQLNVSGGSVLTITGTQAYTGGTLLSSGTLRLGDGATTNGSINGDINNNSRLEFANTYAQAFAGSISGTGALAKSGSGTLVLTGSNSYSGTTWILQGAVQAGGVFALSGSSVVVTGPVASESRLILDGYSQTVAGVTGTGGIDLGVAMLTINQPSSQTYAGCIGGSGAVTKSGTGILTFTGTNNYTGSTLVANGTLRLGDGATTNGSVVGNIVNNSRVEFANPYLQTYSGSISGTGALQKFGSGTLVVLGRNTFSGTTAVSQGTLQFGDGVTANGSLAGPLLVNGTVCFANPMDQIYAGSISGTGSLAKTGIGKLVLLGPSSFTGTTSILQGVLQLGDGNAQNGSTAGGVRNDALLVFANGTSQTFGGIISGSGSVTKSSSAQLTLTGTHSFTGGFTVSSGTVRFGNASTLNGVIGCSIRNDSVVSFANPAMQIYSGTLSGAGTLLKDGAGTLVLNAASPFAGNVAINAGTLQLGDGVSACGSLESDILVASPTAVVAFNNPASQSFAYDISGSGNVAKSGSGTLVMLGVHSYTGTTSINSGTLMLGAGGALPSNTRLVLSSATDAALDLNNQFQQVGSVSGGGKGTINLRAGQLTVSQTTAGTFAGVISGVGGNLIKLGTQTLTLSNTNTFTGSATVSEGVLRLGNGVSCGVLSGGLVSNSETAFANPVTQTYAGPISGTGVLTKASGGILILTGSNTFSGTTRVNEGVLQLGNASTPGSLRGTVVSNASFVVSTPTTQTLEPLLAGTGTFSKTGPGTLFVTGSQSFAGMTTVQGGKLQISSGMALASSTLMPTAGGTLTISPFLNARVGGLAPNAGGITDVSNGTITVAGGLSDVGLVSALLSGRGDGAWNGTGGITSSAARSAVASGTPRTVGWLNNGDGSVAVAFAAAGDTNLDWMVDVLDAANFLSGAKYDSGQPASWNQGDFGYDGVVDILDAAEFVSTGLFDAGLYNGSSGSLVAVPEPNLSGISAAGLSVVAAAARLVRSRKKST